jgi:hypothetical protein
MTSPVTKKVEGKEYRIGDIRCPSPDLCDVTPEGINSPTEGPEYEAYVHRHAADHKLGEFKRLEDAERNLGVWCFYFFHKFVWGNDELTPIPFWETHAFIAEPEWNVEDLEQDAPMDQRVSARKPPSARGATRYSSISTSISSTTAGTSARSSARRRARTRATRSRSFAAWRRSQKTSCGCTASGRSNAPHAQQRLSPCASEKVRVKRIALVNETRGAGGYGQDMVSFRWLTDAEDADSVAAYSVWVAGLETETTGQRPDRYKWDDPQTDKNARTPELRAKIIERFDDSVRQLQFGGEMLVFDTRKFVDDFAGKIRKEPLKSLFFSLHRKVRWPTDEPENPPYVVNGYRYYYPRKGTGERALDEREVNNLERQMSERNFSAEYMNEPLDPTKALFKRDHFKIIKPEDAPIEVRYGLGRNVSPHEEQELRALGLRIFALNSIDPAGKEEQSVRGDDTFIVGLRCDRYGAVYITLLVAGKWGSTRVWDEIAKANAYNRPEFNDYELPASEMHVKSSFEKWTRDRSDNLGAPVTIPMRWSHMPKSGKYSRIEQMEQWTKNGRFFILSNAADEELIEKYIAQWVGYLVSDHDDGPDATSRLIRWLITNSYQKPEGQSSTPAVGFDPASGSATVPVSLIKEMSIVPAAGQLWGETGW